MAESEVSVRFTSKEDVKLWQSFQKLATNFTKVDDAAKKTRQSTDAVDVSLKKFADREIKLNAGPLDQYVAKLSQLDAALKADMLTQDQHARAVARAQDQYRASWRGDAGKKLEIQPVTLPANATVRVAEPSAELKRLAERVREIQTTPIERMRAEFGRLDSAVKHNLLSERESATEKSRLWKQYQADLANAGQSQQKLSAGAVAAGFVIGQAWTAALGAVRSLGSAMAEENQRALQAHQESARSVGVLAQLTGDPEELKKLEATAKGLVKQGAAKSMQEAVQAVFAASSSNALGDLPQLAKLATPGVISSIPEFIRSAEAVRSAMGGKEAGSIAEITAKSFAAAAPTTTTAEKLVIGAARAGTQAQAQGLNINELLSGVGMIATARGSAEEGGTRMAALLRGMESDPSLRGKGLVGSIREIQSRNLDPEALTKQLTAEGADAFRILAGSLDKLEKTINETSRASTSVIDERAKAAMGLDSVRADVMTRQGAAARDVNRGSAEGRFQALNEEASQRAYEERRAGTRSGILDYSLGLTRLLPTQTQRDINATMGKWSDEFVAHIPGGMFDRRHADSEKTNPELRKELQTALADRDTERARREGELTRQQQEAAKIQLEAAQTFRAAVEGQRQAPRFNWNGAAQRDAAVEAR